MHNYNVGNRFTTKTKLGNWYEEKELDDHQFKEYLYQKANNNNLTLNTTAKLGFSNQQLQLTSKGEGLRYGDCVQLENAKTLGVLAFNLNQSILGQETYAVTTSPQKEPKLRNVFILQAVTEEGAVIRFGDKVRLTSQIGNRKLYLHSLPVSPMRSSKFSREQEVSMTATLDNRSIWVIQTVNAKERFDSVGKQVPEDQPILLKHLSTGQWLASQQVKYVNDFGSQYEAYAKSVLSTNKTQNLFAEKEGHRSVGNSMRSQGVQNQWKVIKG